MIVAVFEFFNNVSIFIINIGSWLKIKLLM